MNILNEICDKKRAYVAERGREITLHDIKNRINHMPAPRGFINAIKSHAKPSIIAEVKKASPSAGIIRADFDAVQIARVYEANGAACLSVLTDEPYFQGKDEYLTAIRENVSIPLLRKDFVVDEYQIYESRALGADCILLIMASLDDAQAKGFYQLAESLKMDVLVEVHDDEELDRALEINPRMIGVNNRNLKTMVVDVDTSRRLVKKIPEGIVSISESGLVNAATISSLIDVGFDGFLVGESLMKQPDIGAALAALMKIG